MIPRAVIGDRHLTRVIIDSAFEAFMADGRRMDRARWFLQSLFDPNDWRLVQDNATGVRYLPLTTDGHRRTGARERVLDVARRYPDRLSIVLNALATRVLLDEDRRAIGVEYLAGRAALPRAHAAERSAGERRALYASREVVLAGGAFNSPQLLMLSGIGPADALRRHGIEPRVPLPGVGANLQDRYEVGVVNRMNMKAWEVYDGATFGAGDPQFAEWSGRRKGVYATNGAVLTLFKRSAPDVPVPDLFCMALLASFQGYYPGYSGVFAQDLNALTWVVLKGHTQNRAGTVTLRSADPLDTPAINFNYFTDGGDADVERRRRRYAVRAPGDAHAARAGIVARKSCPATRCRRRRARRVRAAQRLGAPRLRHLRDRPARDERGGGHRLPRAHTRNLRVVDASVFPRIPGFFILSAIYMIGEKAADVILADAERRG